jgi:hypothetical protein
VQDETYPQTDRSTTPTKGREATHLRREIDDELDFYTSTISTTGKGYVFRNSYIEWQDGYGRDERRMEKD